MSSMQESRVQVAIRVDKLSIAAPAFNEAEGIVSVVQGWIDYLSDLETMSDYEIVICNDGSKDQTGALLDALSASNPRVRPVHHAKNQGAAAALSHAIKSTRNPWVLLIDSDGQYGIETVPKLIAKLDEEPSRKAVMGVRVQKHDSSFARFGSWISGRLCNTFHGTHYRDFNCALKLVDGDVLRSLNLEAKGLNYSGEISSKLIERGIVLAEVDVEHRPRASGRSSAQNLRTAWHRLLFVMYIGVRQFLIRQQVLQISQTSQ